MIGNLHDRKHEKKAKQCDLDEPALKHWVAIVFNELENQNSLQMSLLINSSGIIHFSGASSG